MLKKTLVLFLFVSCISCTILINNDKVVVSFVDGSQYSYLDGYAVYTDGYGKTVFTDDVDVYCDNVSALIQGYSRINYSYLGKTVKIVNISGTFYLNESNQYLVSQNITYDAGVLARNFLVNENGSVKTSYNWTANNVNSICYLKLTYGGWNRGLNGTIYENGTANTSIRVYRDDKFNSNELYNFKAMPAYIDWNNDVAQTQNVQRTAYGEIILTTKAFKKNVNYDPVIMVLNYTTCTNSNNEGVANNIYGQSFIFNSTAPNNYITAVEIGFLNTSTAGTQFTAGTNFTLRLHYNESTTNSTVLFREDVTTKMQQAASAFGCANSKLKNITLTGSTGNGFGPLNYSGNYTWSIEINGEAPQTQWWDVANYSNPYPNGRMWMCNGAVGFTTACDTVFRVYSGPPPSTCVWNGVGDWVVNCADNCLVANPLDMGGNSISISGTGTFTTIAKISNFKTVNITGTDGTNKCDVKCDGGCFQTN